MTYSTIIWCTVLIIIFCSSIRLTWITCHLSTGISFNLSNTTCGRRVSNNIIYRRSVLINWWLVLWWSCGLSWNNCGSRSCWVRPESLAYSLFVVWKLATCTSLACTIFKQNLFVATSIRTTWGIFLLASFKGWAILASIFWNDLCISTEEIHLRAIHTTS